MSKASGRLEQSFSLYCKNHHLSLDKTCSVNIILLSEMVAELQSRLQRKKASVSDQHSFFLLSVLAFFGGT